MSTETAQPVPSGDEGPPKLVQLNWMERRKLADLRKQIDQLQGAYDACLGHATRRLRIGFEHEYKPVLDEDGQVVALELVSG